MAENFYTILTTTGKAKIANSAALGTKVNFKTLKVGDGNGAYYEPTENQTSLINKVWEGNIGAVTVDETNSNWIVTETTIPASDGGFFIREAGIFDEDGDLIAIAKMAATYKPVAAEGTTKDLSIRIILEVSNSSSITLKVDPNVIIATKKDIQIISNSISSIGTQLSDMVYQTAGGAATTITLTIKGTLINGYPITFIASANNGGTTTTINGKKLYKPGTTTSPNLIAGKAYTVWYNSISDCFFIKASAEGDADVSHVLATKKFSNDNDTGLTGTMPNNGAVNQSLPINGTYIISKGFHDGTGKVTQSIPTKAGTTINPSTSQQVISGGQYLTGDQIITAITGTATDADVIAGKTYNSSAGILRTGTAVKPKTPLLTNKYTPIPSIAYKGASIPVSKTNTATVQYNGKIYVFGGYFSNNAVSSSYVFDILSNTWSAIASMPVAGYAGSAVAYNNKIYVTGLQDVYGKNLGGIYIYDIASNSWTTGANLITAVSNPAVVINGANIYVIGGTITSVTYVCQMYNITTNTWSNMSSISTGISGARAAVYNGSIFLLGGTGGSSANSDIFIYTISTNTWVHSSASLLTTRMGYGLVVSGSIAYLIGGSISGNYYNGDIDYIDLSLTNASSATQGNFIEINPSLTNVSAEYYAGNIFIVSGLDYKTNTGSLTNVLVVTVDFSNQI